MKKVLISGYYGFGNIGDEAILQTMIEQLNSLQNAIDITVLSAQPEDTTSKFDVHAVNRSGVLSVIKAIRKSDVLISGGGSLLQESTGKLSIFYYLFIYFIAMIFKKEIVIYSQGIGPVHRKLSKKLIKYIFNRVSSISVRDLESKEELVRYGVKRSLIDVTADPVIAFNHFSIEAGKEVLNHYEGYDETLPTIGFALKNSKTQCISEVFVDIINELKRTPCNIVLLPFHYTEDQEIINRIVQQSTHQLVAVNSKQTVNDMFSIIKAMDVLVGVRLHALIFSAVVATPIVGISYDPKIDAFLSAVDEKKVCNIDSLDCLTVIKGIQERLKSNDKYSEKLYSRVNVYKGLLEDYNQQIVAVLNKR